MVILDSSAESHFPELPAELSGDNLRQKEKSLPEDRLWRQRAYLCSLKNHQKIAMKYKHLTPHQRYTISVMLQRQMTMTVIAQTIGVTKATVSREVKRNCDKRGKHAYRWDLAQRKYEKLRFGDFEIDTIIGKNRKGAVMTINDRCTKIVFIRRLTGKEFARHKEIAKGLDVQFFFARPYHSWERGVNENTNGLARQYIPKGTDFEDLTDEYIAEVEWKLNHRPRKSLGYLTPLEYFKKCITLTSEVVALPIRIQHKP